MTFISKQSFDDDGKIEVFTKKDLVFENFNTTTGSSTIKGQARVRYKTGALGRDQVIPFDSIRSAEAHVLEDGAVFWTAGAPPLNHIESDSRLAHRISTVMSSIAMTSKRAATVAVVCHPSVRESVDQCWDKTKEMSRYLPDQDDPVKTIEPYFPNGPLEVFETDLAPEDRVLVLFKGENDQDQIVLYVEGEGLLVNTLIENYDSYGKFVRIS